MRRRERRVSEVRESQRESEREKEETHVHETTLGRDESSPFEVESEHVGSLKSRSGEASIWEA